ncbi:MAG: hypothetical protein B7Y99_12365 [Caulobacterales bacterium 32-69-10]|nr:MAG: hypothetical protein B7Y99_12365 [Caulobacterales bacterium 32-69-10]
MAAWTYILRCADGSYYVGCTTDLDQRLGQHADGTLGGYTSTRRPLELVWSVEVPTIHEAIETERQIKGWGHAKKEALIRGDWTTVQFLSARGR